MSLTRGTGLGPRALYLAKLRALVSRKVVTLNFSF